jgi:hypothetical protein
MAFPVSPTEGQTFTENNTVWIYSAVMGQWNRSVINPLNETTYIGSDGAPGGVGSNTQVIFNDNGSLAGDADLTWNKTTNKLTAAGDIELNDGVGTFTTTLQTVTPTANRTISFPNATGTVGLVAGSSGQLVYNNAGAYAGVSTMTFDGTSVTLAGRLINSYTSVASSPAKVFTGTWFTGGTSTTTKPHLLIEPAGATSTAWSTSGTGIGVNAASGFAGNLLDLQVNGTSTAIIDSVGRLLTGTTTPLSSAFIDGGAPANGTRARYQVSSADWQVASLASFNYQAANVWSQLVFNKSTSNTAGTIGGAVATGTVLGGLTFAGSDSSKFAVSAEIRATADGTWGVNDAPGRLTFHTSADGTATPAERLRITSDGVRAYNQPAPTSKSAAATLTIAELKTAIVQYTGSADTLTLPTGTLMEGGFSGIYTNMTFEWSVINTGSGTVTIGAGADHTIVGHATVAAGDSGRFASRRTASNTFVSYRLS